MESRHRNFIGLYVRSLDVLRKQLDAAMQDPSIDPKKLEQIVDFIQLKHNEPTKEFSQHPALRKYRRGNR